MFLQVFVVAWGALEIKDINLQLQLGVIYVLEQNMTVCICVYVTD